MGRLELGRRVGEDRGLVIACCSLLQSDSLLSEYFTLTSEWRFVKSPPSRCTEAAVQHIPESSILILHQLIK